MRIDLRYALTEQDYYEFNQAYLQHRKALLKPGASTWGIRLATFVFIAIVVVVLLFILPSFQSSSPAGSGGPLAVGTNTTPRDTLLGLLPCTVVFVAMFGFIFWLRKGKQLYRQAFSESSRLAEPHEMTVTDEGVTLREPGCVMQMEWTYFLKLAETPGTFVLFIDARLGHIVPKRAFTSADDMNAFRTFCQAHAGKGTGGFPVGS